MGKSTISMAIFNCYVSSPEGKTCHFSIQIPQELGLQTNPYSAPAMAAGRNPICTAMGIKMASKKARGDATGSFFYSKKMQKSKFRFGCCQLLYFFGGAFSKWVKAVCTRLIPLYPEVRAEFKVIPWCWHSNAEQIILVPLNRFKAEIDFHHVLNTRMTWLSCIYIYHTYVYIIHIIHIIYIYKYIYTSIVYTHIYIYTHKFGDPKTTGFP